MKTLLVLVLALTFAGCNQRQPQNGANTFEYINHAPTKIYLESVVGFTPPRQGAGYLIPDASKSISGGSTVAIPKQCVMRWSFMGDVQAIPSVFNESVVDLSHLPSDALIGIRFEFSEDEIWSAGQIRAVTF